jgi:hypothetical protein
MVRCAVLRLGTMRHFHLQQGPETSAALSEAEVAARLASGELTPDHPCRPAEEDVWRTVADFFPTGSGLKVRTAKPPASAAEQISAAHRIDDPTRRRLLAYGLADAVNLDGFTQSQALIAIVRKEAEVRSAWRAHRLLQAGAFLALLVLGAVVGATTNPLSLRIEKSAALLQRQDGDVKATFSVLRGTLSDYAYVRERDRRNSGGKTKPAKK